jgi:sterol 3beta-glucosyltransferase
MDKQPPFPEPGTTAPQDPPAKHPNAERLLNAAARHVFPEHPAPDPEDDEDNAQLNKPDGEMRQTREEEPLLRGTPLDELMTPGIGLPASSLSKAGAQKAGDEQQDKTNSKRPGRPGFGAAKGVGSDSVGITHFLTGDSIPVAVNYFGS